MPDGSVLRFPRLWPVVAGVAIMLLVAAAIWWPRGEDEPGPFAGTITVEGQRFDYTEIRLAAGAEATMTLRNLDAGVAHNIYIVDTRDGHLEPIGGCIEGCAGDGSATRTELVEGVASRMFTFTVPPPGRYAFWCEVHPDTMAGELIAE